jgi:hypothetical protein
VEGVTLEPDTVRLGLGVGFVAIVLFRFGRGLPEVNFDLDDPSYSISEPSSTSGLLARFLRGFGVGLEEDWVFVLEGTIKEVTLCFLLGAGESER